MRGIVEELQQQNAAAPSDYGVAIRILRSGRDQLLPATGIDFRASAHALAEWRDSSA